MNESYERSPMHLMLKDEDRVLYEKCQAAEKAFCEDWKTLVDIDSPTGYTEGITRVGRIIIAKAAINRRPGRYLPRRPKLR